MASAQCLALCVVAVMVAVSAANLGGKCKPKEGAMKQGMGMYKECYEEVTGKPFDMDAMRKEDGPTKEEKAAMELCISKKVGIIDDDGQFDVDAAKKNLNDDIETDDETKANIEAAIDACDAAGGDTETVLDCLHDAYSKNCRA